MLPTDEPLSHRTIPRYPLFNLNNSQTPPSCDPFRAGPSAADLSIAWLRRRFRSRGVPALGGDHLSQLALRYLARPFQILTDKCQFLVLILLGQAHVSLAHRLVFRNQRLEASGTHTDEHLAAVSRVPHSCDEPALLQPVENMGHRSRREPCPVGEPACSHGAVGVAEDEVDTLRVRGVQTKALGDGLMKKNSLRAHFPAEVPNLVQQLAAFGFYGVWA